MKYGWKKTLFAVSSIVFIAHETLCAMKSVKVSEQNKESACAQKIFHFLDLPSVLQVKCLSYLAGPKKPELARGLVSMRLVSKHFNTLLPSSTILNAVWKIPELRQRTSLHHAAGKGNTIGLRTLIQLGCNVDTLEKAGAAALHYAAKHDKLDAVKILLEEGKASVDSRTSNQATPLHFVQSEAVARALLQAKANVHHVDISGQNALHRAFARAHNSKEADFKGTFDVVGVLALNCCSMSMRDKRGKTPIEYAPAALLAVNERVYGAYQPERRELLRAVTRLHDMLTPS